MRHLDHHQSQNQEKRELNSYRQKQTTKIPGKLKKKISVEYSLTTSDCVRNQIKMPKAEIKYTRELKGDIVKLIYLL